MLLHYTTLTAVHLLTTDFKCYVTDSYFILLWMYWFFLFRIFLFFGALGYGLDDRGFESRQGLGILLYTSASRLALGPTQPPIQWVSRSLSLGVKRPGREADYSPPSSTEVKE
jgi:hypothetical protein